MVESDAVERVEKGEPALNLVRLNHTLENVVDGDTLSFARQVVGDGENGAKVVRRVAPLSSQETVVVV